MALLDSVTMFLAPPAPDLPQYNYEQCKVSALDIVKGWEKWPNTKVKLCAEPVPYNHLLIERALKKDRNLYQLYESLITNFYPEPYQDPVPFSDPHDNFVCGDLCPGLYRNATAVILTEPVYKNGRQIAVRDFTCNVVRPWEQVIPFMTCSSHLPNLEMSANATLYCVPNSFVEREIVVFCEQRHPQCMSVKMKVPLACSIANIKCRAEEIINTQMSQSEIDFLRNIGLSF